MTHSSSQWEDEDFFQVVIRGPSAIHGHDKISGGANLDARDNVTCNISQLLIYNTSKGTHHAVKTAAVCHTKERETHFPLYQELKLHRQGRNKKQIEINHKQGISVSYKWVMDVKLKIAQAVCARHACDGVVLPSNSRLNVFTTHDVDNFDIKAQRNFINPETTRLLCNQRPSRTNTYICLCTQMLQQQSQTSPWCENLQGQRWALDGTQIKDTAARSDRIEWHYHVVRI